MKIGIITKDLGAHQLGRCIANKFSEFSKTSNIDTCVFCRDYNIIPSEIHFPIYPVSHIWGFDGILIATDLLSAKYLLEVPNPYTKYFYLWDLYWVFETRNISYILPAYTELELLTRTEHYAKIIEKAWKKPFIIGDLEPEKLNEIRKRN